VEDIQKVKKEVDAMSYDRYAKIDYEMQYEMPVQQGDSLSAGRVLQELIRMAPTLETYKKQKQQLLQQINSTAIVYLPFEIDIQFKNGYQTIFPAYTRLPLAMNKHNLVPSQHS